MIQFASAKFYLDHKTDDGSTRRDHAQSIYKQTRKWPEDYPEEPMLPDALRYVWDWFVDLSNGRGSSGFGPNPLSWPDYDAWCRMMDIRLEKWEFAALRRLDATYLMSQSGAKEKK